MLCHKLLLVPLRTMSEHDGTSKTGVATLKLLTLNDLTSKRFNTKLRNSPVDINTKLTTKVLQMAARRFNETENVP